MIVDIVGGRSDRLCRLLVSRAGRPPSVVTKKSARPLRKTPYVQFKIRDNDVYEKALGYVREYY